MHILFTLLFILYLILNILFLQKPLKSILRIRDDWLVFVLSLFLVIYLLSYIGGVFIVFYKFNSWVIIASLALNVFLIFILRKLVAPDLVGPALSAKELGRPQPAYYLVLSLLFIAGFVLLLSSQTDKYIDHPWEVINSGYLAVYFVLTFLIAYGILSFPKYPKYPKYLLLIIIVLHSFLLHAYLPLVYRLPFGIDTFRHIGREAWLEDGKIIEPIGTEALLFNEKNNYASLWSLELFLHKITGLSLITVNTYLIFILWSFFLPFLLYQFSGYLIKKQRFRLLFCFLPVLFYPMQSLGAMTLPVSFGFLFFIFFLIIWLEYFKGGKSSIFYLGLFLLLASYFGYIIYFLFGLGIAGFLILWRGLKMQPGWFPRKTNQVASRLLLIAYCSLFTAVLFLIELWRGPFALIKKPDSPLFHFLSFWVNQIVAHIFGIVGEVNISQRYQDGNYFFHQMAEHLSSSWFLGISWIDSLLMFIVIALAIAGVYAIKKNAQRRRAQLFFLLLFVIVIVNIFASWYFIDGIHLFVERMDLIASLFLLLMIVLGIQYILNPKSQTTNNKQISNSNDQNSKHFEISYLRIWNLFGICYLSFGILTFSIIISLFSLATYASGPIYGRVTPSHLQAAEFIVKQRIEEDNFNWCVLAEHRPIAAIDAVSRGRIRYGNFPLDYAYSSDLSYTLLEMLSQPSLEALEFLKQELNVNGCYFIGEQRLMTQIQVKLATKLLGEPEVFGEVYVWRY